MKKLLILTNLLLISFISQSQDWHFLGDEGVHSDTIASIEMFVEDDIPYVIYNRPYNNFVVSVKRYINNNWEYVGDTIVVEPGYLPDIFVYEGTPFICYFGSSRVYVKKFSNGTWENVGQNTFAIDNAHRPRIFIENNIPYVIYRDTEFSNKLSVSKFNNGSWEVICTRGFSRQYIDNYDFVVREGVVYAVESGSASGGQVFKSDGSNWVNLGPMEVTATGSTFHSLAFDYDGKLYLAYKDQGFFNKCSVKTYNSSDDSWSYLGGAGISSGQANFERIAIIDNIPFIAFTNFTSDYKTKVMKYENGNWIDFGNSEISHGHTWYNTISVTPHGVYVSYKDIGLYERGVVQFTPFDLGVESNKEIAIDVYPNPSSESIRITGNYKNLTIKIMDVDGKLLEDYNNVNSEDMINISHLKNGIYLIRIKNGENEFLKKFIKY